MPHSPDLVLPDAELDIHRDRRRAIAVYVGSVLLMLVVIGTLMLEQYRRDTRAAEERTAARADLVAEWVTSTFSASEVLLASVAARIEDEAPAELGGWLTALGDEFPFLDKISVLDSQGRVLVSSSDTYPPGYALGGLPYHRDLLQAPVGERLVTPLFWSHFVEEFRVVHAQRLAGGGIVSAELELSAFSRALDRLGMAAGQSTAIIDTQMQLIARRPVFGGEDPLEVLGEQISEPLTRAFIDSGLQRDSFRTASPLDGEERYYTMRRVGELPFVAVIGEEVSTVLTGWMHRLWLRLVIAATVIGLGGLVLRHYLNRLRLEAEVRQRVAEREQARHESQSREARLQALVGSIQDMIFVFDGTGRFVFVHAPDPGELLLDSRELIGRHYREALPGTLADQLTAAFAELREGGGPVEVDYRLEIHGEGRHFRSVLSTLGTGGPDTGGALAVVRDVTEERATEAQLRIAATAFETHLGMLITDAEGAILRVNDTFTRITGYAEEEVLGRNPRLLSSGLHDDAFYAGLWDSVARHGSWQGEIWNRRRNGEVFPEWLTISAVRNAEVELTHYVATFSDLTERKAAEQEIHQLAFFDSLTGLPNRRLLMDRLEGVLRDSYRNGRFGALMFLDLDNFKQVNDTLGHHSGDQLLRSVARRLGAVVRDTDTLARLGGDEFALLLHDLGERPEAVAVIAERVAHKLLSALQAPVLLGGERLTVTGSLGITLCRDHETSLDEVLQQADMALFQAKGAGRNTLSFFDPEMQVRLQARARLEADLRQALPREEFHLHYQPQVTASGEILGVEALLRWQHPRRGIVSPGEFIPLAEENRLIVAIGAWVLESACRQLAAWAADPARRHLTLAVNVSPRQFREADFVERVVAILDATRAPAERLKLEVTESLFLEERDQARAKMLRLRERGVRFSLDDFGTGYSSLAYLKRLPLDQLKIDQSFVRDLLGDETSAAIVASIIALARSLELEVIAEGVETEGQRDWLIAHGCQAFQGYLFSRPLPLEQIPLSRIA
ncbi:EAL domain-containing protein [Halomonas sp. SSL-5]|uniref:EAL domain-containing protein n=1 Tax=Halomonas sp. SSL-5 TaxID=3065855 RepID=UPI002739B60B|nr:EAL domain-containing protein [Halomonas sp. SSL-5]MDY7117368.1 EAL domain-containing protein [Halomonas sp. SSL-5]